MFFFLCYFSFVVGASASSIYRDVMMLARWRLKIFSISLRNHGLSLFSFSYLNHGQMFLIWVPNIVGIKFGKLYWKSEENSKYIVVYMIYRNNKTSVTDTNSASSIRPVPTIKH